MTDSLTFVLTPDGDAARRLRRHLATIRPRIGVRVGTWLELLDEVRNAYLLREPSGWDEALHAALTANTGAFWHRSYLVDPGGVTQTVTAAWRMILESQPPMSAWPTCDSSDRISKRLADLETLNTIPYTQWPDDLAMVAEFFNSDAPPIRPIRIHTIDWDESLTPWQQAAIKRINADSGPASDDLVAEVLAFCENVETASAPLPSRLRVIQENLGSACRQWPEADGSFELLGVRDELECIEIAAGLIQNQLRTNLARKPSDFGIVVPHGFEHAERIKKLFMRCGLPLSNLTGTVTERDLAHELLRFALMRFEGLAPSMAVQALVSNPLMPWSLESGRLLANTLTDFGFSLKKRYLESEAHLKILELFEQPIPIESVPQYLRQLLNALNADPALEVHRQRAESSGQRIIDAFQSASPTWERLRDMVPTQNFSICTENDVSQEGVCVVTEGRLPLREVEHLLILGFTQGRYPNDVASPAVFSPDEWRELQTTGIDLKTQTRNADIARRVLKRQIKQASHRLTILMPKLSSDGSSSAPSASLMDFALLAGKVDSPDAIVLDIERERDRNHVPDLPLIARKRCVEPRPIEAQDISLDVNLLASFEVSIESPRTLSPSTLDNLLVSPLAWLLKQLDAEPKSWVPDEFDPITNGSIAHEVFEALFPQGCIDPDADELVNQVGAAFEQGVRQISPSLSAPEWTIERDHLRGVIERAVRVWSDTMAQLGARLIQPEISLRGHFDGIAIAGRADAVIEVPNVGAVVVDYKNSRSDKFLTRMEREFDLQTVLYREMLKTGGARDRQSEAAQRLKGMQPTGVMYFAMQDGQAVADFQAPSILGNWRFAGREVSSQGLAKLRERFAELRRGEIRAPRESEIKAFEQAKVGLYALDTSSLTAALHPGNGEGA